MAGIFKIAFMFLAGVALCFCKVDGTDANSVTTTNASAPSAAIVAAEKHTAPVNTFPTIYMPDISWKNGVGQALLIGGAAVLTFVTIGGLTLLLAPVAGVKLCHVMGNCDQVTYAAAPAGTVSSANQPYSSDVYGAYIPAAAYANYQKRSIDYAGPILEVLKAAYKKYGQATATKKAE